MEDLASEITEDQDLLGMACPGALFCGDLGDRTPRLP